MSSALSDEAVIRLEEGTNIWFGSVRPDGRPHLAPVWFVFWEGRLYISTDPHSVKSHNIDQNPQVVLALEDGTHPVMCEGMARPLSSPYPRGLLAAFFEKYEWDLEKEQIYQRPIEITPTKWIAW